MLIIQLISQSVDTPDQEGIKEVVILILMNPEAPYGMVFNL
jgi:hypothetical protein